ncbi:hypothetical protein [Botrimarina hoheduenensis]|uniref:Dockerin domain-containing protein n=1 Tax=Botrimarina hoheduenensis TaxID=2528000 RepID=A0A5C5WBV5_9BACT|nr:hypothetical protein [Botrimarina hoheduenensis]TWT47541.1 hypothetical protein Pla111_11560 [Botrimarina hoheduenensis]
MRTLLKLLTCLVATLHFCGAVPVTAQTIASMRADQLARLQTYVLDAIQPSGLVRDSLVLSPSGTNFHPATPDAAGFALLSLAAFDQLGTLPNADQRVVQILNAHVGNTPGVNPVRSPDGHFLHFIDIVNGSDPPGWDDSYSPISSALVVAGAQFASNHFAGTSSPLAGQIAALADQLTASVDFDAAIHPSLDGRVYLDMTAAGGGAGGTLRPWNEYQLVVSLALRQQNNDRAVAVRRQWFNTDLLPRRGLGPYQTLTDNPNAYASAFWTQQAQFFNGDFRHDDDFQTFLENHKLGDELYSSAVLNQAYRYGLTAGVNPSGYHADRPFNHPDTVFSPSAVAAWGDLDTLLQFYLDQLPATNPRYRYGLARVSDEQPTWIPNDAGLVDHLFLLFGLVESLHPDFFADRVFAPLVAGDYNFDGEVDLADYTVWRDTLGGADLSADGDLDGDVDQQDYAVWAAALSAASASALAIPEPASLALLLPAWLLFSARRQRCR